MSAEQREFAQTIRLRRFAARDHQRHPRLEIERPADDARAARVRLPRAMLGSPRCDSGRAERTSNWRSTTPTTTCATSGVGDPSPPGGALNLARATPVKFTAKGPREGARDVRRRGGAPRAWPKVAIEDTGIGIRAQAQATIFESSRRRTVRPHASSAAPDSGCRSAANDRLMGGDLQLTGQPGKDVSDFTLALPIAQGASQAGQAEDRRSDPAQHARPPRAARRGQQRGPPARRETPARQARLRSGRGWRRHLALETRLGRRVRPSCSWTARCPRWMDGFEGDACPCSRARKARLRHHAPAGDRDDRGTPLQGRPPRLHGRRHGRHLPGRPPNSRACSAQWAPAAGPRAA